MRVNVPKNQFAFPTGISSHNDFVATVKYVFDDFELLQCSGIRFVSLFRFYLSRNQFECFGNNRQMFPAESRKAVFFGHGERYQMSKSPRNHVIVSMHKSVFFLGSANDTRYLAGYRWLFCYNCCFHFVGF
ncbi:hypothetical protein Barb7_00257 [Bacteroidales bacterium Barb7]|nr:hypothetical protein Barb7_00257 [Bacteroidales bacterium Barb7]